jgi:hypothetical protein
MKGMLSLFSTKNQMAVIDIFTIENLRTQEVATLKSGLNIIKIEQNLIHIKTIRITYGNSNREEELNFY